MTRTNPRRTVRRKRSIVLDERRSDIIRASVRSNCHPISKRGLSMLILDEDSSVEYNEVMEDNNDDSRQYKEELKSHCEAIG